MPYGILEDQINWGVIMKKKGFTLIEIIIAIAILSLIAVNFLPAITFGFVKLMDSIKFTTGAIEAQKAMENKLEDKREVTLDDPSIDPNSKGTIKVFGVDVEGHIVRENIDYGNGNHGQLNAFLPKQAIFYVVPEIVSPPIIKVRNNSTNVSPQPTEVDILDNDKNLFVHEIDITPETKSEFLMNVYRWYYYDEFDLSSDPDSKDYFIIKEWNEARKIISYEDAEGFGFIPNIKKDYNIFSFSEINLNTEDLIERFGYKYIRYSVTPYSIIGKIGKEEFSNQIYIKAPELNVLSAKFILEIDPITFNEISNKVMITFDRVVRDNSFDIEKIKLNPSLGNVVNISRDQMDNKSIIIELETSIDITRSYDNNILDRGSIASDEYGMIKINNGINGFTISR